MKKSLIVLGIVLILLSSIAVSCGGKLGICGKYVNEENPEEYLVLEKDGTFILRQYEFGLLRGKTLETYKGEWDLVDDTLILSWMGFAVECEVRGNKIIDDEGKVWVKR
jgi:hypothetical protein